MNLPNNVSSIMGRPFSEDRLNIFDFRILAFGCLCLLMWVAGLGKAFAQHLHIAQEGSAESSGIFAYLVAHGGEQHITAVQCSSNAVQVLFTKSISEDLVLPPICVSNAVVVVSVDGQITKYDLNGIEIFSRGMLKPGEVSRLAGRWDPGVIYLTAMIYDSQRTPRYRMLWIDVRGKSPVHKGNVNIGSPKKAFRLENDIVICGDNNTERIAAPTEVRR